MEKIPGREEGRGRLKKEDGKEDGTGKSFAGGETLMPIGH